VEVSTVLKEFGIIRSYSLKNEFHVRAYWDWDEYFGSDTEMADRHEYPDTTLTEEHSYEGDESRGNLTVEIGFVRFLRSGTGLSPCLGVVAAFRPYWWHDSHDYYGEGGLERRDETTRDTNALSIGISGGLRHFFSDRLAVMVHSDLVSYTYRKETRKYDHYYPDGDSTSVSERTNTDKFVSFTMQPTVYLQYYF
jgi:hypothetical protein